MRSTAVAYGTQARACHCHDGRLFKRFHSGYTGQYAANWSRCYLCAALGVPAGSLPWGMSRTCGPNPANASAYAQDRTYCNRWWSHPSWSVRFTCDIQCRQLDIVHGSSKAVTRSNIDANRSRIRVALEWHHWRISPTLDSHDTKSQFLNSDKFWVARKQSF